MDPTCIPGYSHLMVTPSMAPGWCFNVITCQYELISQNISTTPPQSVGLQHQQVFSAGPAQPGLYSPMASLGRAASYQQPRGSQQPQSLTAGSVQPGLYSLSPVASYGQAASHQQPRGLQQPPLFTAGPAQPGLYSSPPVASFGQAASHQQPRGSQQPQLSFTGTAQPDPQYSNAPVVQNFGQVRHLPDNYKVQTAPQQMSSFPTQGVVNTVESHAASVQGTSSSPKVVIDLTNDEPKTMEVAQEAPKKTVSCPQLNERLMYLAHSEPLSSDSAASILQRALQKHGHAKRLKPYCNRFWPTNEEALADLREMARYFIDPQKMFWYRAFWDDAKTEEDLEKMEQEKKKLAVELRKERLEELARLRKGQEHAWLCGLSKPERRKQEAIIARREEGRKEQEAAMQRDREKRKRLQEEKAVARQEAKTKEREEAAATKAAASQGKKRKNAAAPAGAKKQLKENAASLPGAATDPVEDAILAAFEADDDFAPEPEAVSEVELALLAAFEADEDEDNTTSCGARAALPTPPPSQESQEKVSLPSPAVVREEDDEMDSLFGDDEMESLFEDNDMGSLFEDDDKDSLFGDDKDSLFGDDEDLPAPSPTSTNPPAPSLPLEEPAAQPGDCALATSPALQEGSVLAPGEESEEDEEEEEEEESEEMQRWRLRCDEVRAEIEKKDAAMVECRATAGRHPNNRILQKRMQTSIDRWEKEKEEKEKELQSLLDSGLKASS